MGVKPALTLREEQSLWVVDKMVRGKIFGPMRQEETGRWIKLHIHQLHDLHSLLRIIWVNKSRRMHSAF
jgi:hypothetical protein